MFRLRQHIISHLVCPSAIARTHRPFARLLRASHVWLRASRNSTGGVGYVGTATTQANSRLHHLCRKLSRHSPTAAMIDPGAMQLPFASTRIAHYLLPLLLARLSAPLLAAKSPRVCAPRTKISRSWRCTGSANGHEPRPVLSLEREAPGLCRATAATSPYFRQATASVMVHEGVGRGSRVVAAGMPIYALTIVGSESSSVLMIHVEKTCKSNVPTQLLP